MKKQFLVLVGILLLVVITACGTNNTSESEPVKEDVKETNNTDVQDDIDDLDDNDDSVSTEGTNNETDDDMQAQLDTLDFTEIEISVSYGDDKDFEVSVDRDDDRNERTEVEIEDELNNVFYQGREAFEHIFPKLETLDFTPESSEEDVIQQTLNAFDLADDYQEFEIEVYFQDGSRIDFEHRK